jgi:pyruvate/2-oxoglutarate dehydrogenase complex dihydrolipoamide acyltransferase (E2) component
MQRPPHDTLTYPDSRIGTLDLGRIAARRHHVAGLLEVDVTSLLAYIRALKKEGVRVSFFAWITKVVGDAIAENRYIHAAALGRKKLVVFEDVDISIIVEREVQGQKVPIPLLIRNTNTKAAQAIYEEIRQSQFTEIAGEQDYVMSDVGYTRGAMRLYYSLPQWMRIRALNWIMKSPFRMKQMMGTALITSVGTAGHLAGWIVPKTMHNLSVAIGSIVKKPWVVENRIEVRDILHLTVIFDHDIVDGVPAMKFVSRLVDRIQNPGS